MKDLKKAKIVFTLCIPVNLQFSFTVATLLKSLMFTNGEILPVIPVIFVFFRKGARLSNNFPLGETGIHGGPKVSRGMIHWLKP